MATAIPTIGMTGKVFTQKIPKPAAVSGLIRPGEVLTDESDVVLTDENDEVLTG